jgi:hypothetical protein
MTESTPLEPTGSLEPADAPAPTTPVVGGLTPQVRWLIAAGAIVAAIAIVGVAYIVLSARPVPAALTYIPADADVVAELRMDLPGDQLQRVGNLLAHFPGFQDQSTLPQKLDESLARITGTLSNGTVDYASQVQPWLAGPLFAGIDAGAMDPDGSPSWVIAFTTDGSVTCEPFMSGSTATEPYRGLDLHVPDEDGGGIACALDGRQAVVGSVAGVKAGLDAHATNGGVDSVADYRTARDRLAGDRLATVFVGYKALTTQILEAMPSDALSLSPGLSGAAASLPAWLIAGVRAEDNALVADVVTAPLPSGSAFPMLGLPTGSPAPSLLTPPPAHESALTRLVPGDTALLFEAHGTGVTIQNYLAVLRSMPGLTDQLGELGASLDALGGAAGLVGWVGDAGIVVMPDGEDLTAGLVLQAPDDATAAARADQIRGLLALAATQAGFTISDTTIGGVKVTLVDLGDAAELVVPGMPVSGANAIPPGTRIVISLAARGPLVMIGYGESFARRILETAAGSTLADSASYKTALGLAEASNTGQLYLAAAPLSALGERLIPASEQARYQGDIEPYLAPFDALLQTTTIDASGLRARLVVTVK